MLTDIQTDRQTNIQTQKRTLLIIKSSVSPVGPSIISTTLAVRVAKMPKLTHVFDVDPYFESSVFHSVSYLEHRGLRRPVVADEDVSVVLCS